MPKKLLVPLQQAALKFLLNVPEALIQAIASSIKEDRPRTRGVMRDLAERGLVSRRKFKGMTQDMDDKQHLASYLVYSITGAGRKVLEKSAEQDVPDAVKKATYKRSNLNAAIEVALLAFVDAVDEAGGVIKHWNGDMQLVAFNLATLGSVYMTACAALQRRPKVSGR